MHAILPLLRDSDFPAIQRASLKTVQVNLGYRCNQSCLHCHVNAGPKRTEAMNRETVDLVLDGGRTPGEMASTILDVTVSPPRILREGLIPKEQLDPFF